MKKTLVFLFAAAIMFSVFTLTAQAAPGDNIAMNMPVEACAQANDDEAAKYAVDDDPGYETKWCGNDGPNHPVGSEMPNHWIIVDFGEEKWFDKMEVAKTSVGAHPNDEGQKRLDMDEFWHSQCRSLRWRQ